MSGFQLGPPHGAAQDLTLRGKCIPQGAQFFLYGEAINFNRDTFDKPGEFKPERFLKDGSQFQPNARCPIFGFGRRRCIGEMLARAEVYLITASIVQAFQLERPKNSPELNLLEYCPGALAPPLPFEIVFQERRR